MFKSLFGKKKIAIEVDQTLASGIKQAILDCIGNRGIPPMASSAQKAFQLATNPKADARDFVELIESDEGLSARVIKIANSVYFDRGKKSSTIEESVVVIGLNELRSLLNATTLSEIFPSRHPARPQLWAHDVGTAIISKSLAQRIIPAQSDLAFLGGLMHDVGKLLLIQKVSDDYAKVLKKIEETGCDSREAEEDIFPFNHTQVGQLIGERWNFSSDLITIIRTHHEDWDKLEYSPTSLSAIIKAANTASHALAIGHPKGWHRVQNKAQESLENCWEALKIANSERSSMLKDLERAYNLERDLYSGASIP
jgi:putative nucleotidyltransferase with HDIG domain